MDLLILGMGELGQAFYRASKFEKNITIKAYYDPYVNELPFALPSISTFEELLQFPVDGYFLTAVQDKQTELAISLAKSGKKIFIPLPVTISRALLVSIVRDIPEHLLWLIPLPVYFKEILDLKKQLDMKVLGDIGVVEYSLAVSRRPQKWYHDLSNSGGCLYQLLLPLLYEISLLFGKIDVWYGNYSRLGSMDYSNLALRLTNGILVSVETSWGCIESTKKTLEISGEKGNLVFDSRNTKIISFSSDMPMQSYWDSSLDGSANDPLRLLFKEIIEGRQRFPLSDLLVFQNILDSIVMGGGIDA